MSTSYLSQKESFCLVAGISQRYKIAVAFLCQPIKRIPLRLTGLVLRCAAAGGHSRPLTVSA